MIYITVENTGRGKVAIKVKASGSRVGELWFKHLNKYHRIPVGHMMMINSLLKRPNTAMEVFAKSLSMA